MTLQQTGSKVKPSYYLGGFELGGGRLSYLAHRHGKKWNLAEYELQTVQEANVRLVQNLIGKMQHHVIPTDESLLEFMTVELLQVASDQRMRSQVRKIVAEAWTVKDQ